MDAASGAFARLGFPLTPFTIHRNEDAAGERVPTGTANRCAMLRRGYLEILTDVAGLDTPFARAHREAVARHEGLHLIAYSVDDTDAEARRLEEAGFAPRPVAHLRRPMPVDGGGEEEAAFSVLRVPPGTMAEGRMQILRHETPDLVWQDSAIARDNALAGLAGVLVCTDDPAEAAARHARFTGREAAAATVDRRARPRPARFRRPRRARPHPPRRPPAEPPLHRRRNPRKRRYRGDKALRRIRRRARRRACRKRDRDPARIRHGRVAGDPRRGCRLAALR